MRAGLHSVGPGRLEFLRISIAEQSRWNFWFGVCAVQR